MTTEEILRAAALKVRAGWCKGGSGIGDDGAVCAAQAIADVAPDRSEYPAHIRLMEFLGLRVAYWCEGVPKLEPVFEWNDMPGQTAENVASALERAAEQSEATNA